MIEIKKVILFISICIIVLGFSVNASINYRINEEYRLRVQENFTIVENTLKVENISTKDPTSEIIIKVSNETLPKVTFNDQGFGGRTTFTGSMMNNDDINDSSRFVERNINTGSFASSVFTVRNDVPYSASFGLTSSRFSSGLIGSNEAGISSVAPGKMDFIQRYNYPFVWYINFENDSSLDNITEVMRLNGTGLYVQNDIEASGSIYANENIIAVGLSVANITASNTMTANFMTANLITADFVSATNMTMARITHMVGTYSNNEAYVCVNNDGTIYAKDSVCI